MKWTAPQDNEVETITLEADELGKLRPRNQVTDYMLRGVVLEDYNVIDFFVHTYEMPLKKDNISGDSQFSSDGVHRKRGHPSHEHVPYLPNHVKSQIKQRVIRGAGHNNLPNFIGRYFPPRDDPDQFPFYCASMLMLLKPWRKIETDLKKASESWELAFDAFLQTVPVHIHNILSGIQYYHQCRSSAMQQAQENVDILKSINDLENMVENAGPPQKPQVLTEENLLALQASRENTMEDVHAFTAIESARMGKVFEEANIVPWTELEKQSNRNIDLNLVVGGRRSDNIALQNLMKWRKQMQDDIQKQNPDFNATCTTAIDQEIIGDVIQLGEILRETMDSPSVSYLDNEYGAEKALTAVDSTKLRYDQFRAYDIITAHVQDMLSGGKPPPLHMLIHGEPGTGKSQVIQTTTQHFINRAIHHMLMKSAYTGVASSVINGKTTHSIAMISPRKDGTLSANSRRKLQQIWKHIKYLVIDEVSMISKTFLAKLSHNITIGKMTDGEPISPDSFGGISVILCGDFFQFPPVAGGVSDTLYNPKCTAKNHQEDSQAGRIIFEEFTTVVSLTEQMQVTDPVWQQFLTHLRFGQVQQKDVDMLRGLILMRKEAAPIDFSSSNWKDAALVTPRHAVRRLWNETALLKYGKEAHQMILECKAEESIKGEHLTLAEKYTAYLRQVNLDSTQRKQDLAPILQIAIGMKVMVTQNVVTDLDITNGARGTIVDIWLHPDEPPICDLQPTIELKYLPPCVLVKLDHTCTSQLTGLEERVIPVEPAMQSYRISCQGSEGNAITRTVRRRQFPMTAAYAFTDYRSQGQTLPTMIVDITTPPTGETTSSERTPVNCSQEV